MMKDWTVNDIFRMVGMLTLLAIAIVLGCTVFITVAEGILAFASTGIGAIILLIAAYICWRKWKKEQQ